MITNQKAFLPGQQLPNEIALAEQFGVSRVTLREAIQILKLQGVLEAYQGKGTFVSVDMDGHLVQEPVGLPLPRTRDLLEARLLLEPQIVALACLRAEDEELKALSDTVVYPPLDTLSQEERTQKEQEFHTRVIQIAHNDFFQRIIPIVKDSIRSTIEMAVIKEGMSEKAQEVSLVDHSAIVQYLQKRDVHGASCAMSLHLRHTISLLGLECTDIMSL